MPEEARQDHTGPAPRDRKTRPLLHDSALASPVRRVAFAAPSGWIAAALRPPISVAAALQAATACAGGPAVSGDGS